MAIEEAVGAMSMVGPRHAALGKRIEEAMAAAVRDALDQGIPLSDTATIRARMLAAREAVKAEHLTQK